MNPTTQTANRNPFESIETLSEFEKAEAQNDSVTLTPEHKQVIKESWSDFYNLRTEQITEVVSENSVSRQEFSETRIETEFSKPLDIFHQTGEKADFIIESQKETSILEEAGLKLDFPKLGKEVTKSLFGALSLFKEIFMDTVTLVVGKKDKKAEKVDPNPDKARAAAEKKAENQRKQNNIKAFYQELKAAVSSIISPDAARMESQEKANINAIGKIGQESYKGIKDSFGRLTVYAAAMFERGQQDQEKQAKKIEKEQKIASAGGPDLNLDKAAEGGFLSSTGGQGAG